MLVIPNSKPDLEPGTWNLELGTGAKARFLEEDLQRKLNLTGIEGLSGFAKAGTIQVDIGQKEVHAVQQVEKFSPKLQP